MKKYELTILVKKDNKEAENTMVATLKGLGIKKIKSSSWGVKPLAYPIKKLTECLYLYFEFEADPKQAKELEAKLHMDEAIIRNLLVIA